jgi:hypothetical protein
VATPPPERSPSGAGEEGLDVVALVDDFMSTRQQGLPADEFLSPEAQAAYAEHDGGLWLYDDTLPGGPGGEYESFSTEGLPRRRRRVDGGSANTRGLDRRREADRHGRGAHDRE